MMEFKENIGRFLLKNKRKVTNKHLTICIGNEACDLDSFISSLVLAHALNVLFVVNMRKDVFYSKGDLVFVCNKYNININDLIFLETPFGLFSKEAKIIGTYLLVDDTKHFITDKILKLILTDHNEPIEELKHCKIELILDHHPLTYNISSDTIIYIDTDIGSATTLISRYLENDLSKKETFCKKKLKINKSPLCAQLAGLLLIPILVDTKYLKKRVSIFDVIEYKKLKKKSGLNKKHLKTTIKQIKKARKNDHKHATNLILLKDYKHYTSKNYTFGMSVIKYPFDQWINREAGTIIGLEKNKEGLALFCKLESFRKDMGLDFFIVSTKIKNIRFVIILNFPFLKILQDEIDLENVEYKGLTYYKIDVGVTRKLLVPKLIDILQKQ